MTRADRQKQKEAARLYREMVAAVRRWVDFTAPSSFADRLTLSREAGDDIRTLAAFHSEDNEWSHGDWLARDHRI